MWLDDIFTATPSLLITEYCVNKFLIYIISYV